MSTLDKLKFVATLEEAMQMTSCCHCDQPDDLPVASTLLGLLPIQLRIGGAALAPSALVGWTVLCPSCLKAWAENGQ